MISLIDMDPASTDLVADPAPTDPVADPASTDPVAEQRATDTAGDVIIEGARFSSFKDLENALNVYQNSKFVNLCVKRSESIPKRIEKYPKANYKEALKYSRLTYCCKHGGREFVSKSKGVRPNQKTFLKGCPFEIHLLTSSDGQHLEIKKINDEHNHDLLAATYEHMPRQRRLAKEDAARACEVLSLRPNKKILQHHLAVKTGKLMTMRLT